MFDRILVPLDGSELSDQILRHVRRLLLREDATVELYTVVSWPSRSRTPTGRDHRMRFHDEAERYLARVQAQLAQHGATATWKVDFGDPAEMIVRRAQATRPSLVAMASHGRGGLSRWLRGSVAQRVLRECPEPLLLVNSTAQDADASRSSRFERVLVPLDGSERSASIVALVREFSRRFESTVILQSAWHPPAADSASVEAAVERILDPVRETLERDGLVVETRSSIGDPAAEILSAVELEAVDLVAMASHGSGARSRWFSGSVTEKVFRRCPVPVLVKRTRPVTSRVRTAGRTSAPA